MLLGKEKMCELCDSSLLLDFFVLSMQLTPLTVFFELDLCGNEFFVLA